VFAQLPTKRLFLPFRDPPSSLRDIYEAIESIERFVEGMDFPSFQADEKTSAAVERKLLVLSEAAHRLGDAAEHLCPGIPWNNIRGIGNWLRHQYDGVDPSVIWQTIEQDMPPLKAAVSNALVPPDGSPQRASS
jgi:uncharacterized protein with HEPN domain